MSTIFDTWKTVDVEIPTRQGNYLDHSIGFRDNPQGGAAIVISVDLLREINAKRFSLKSNNGIFALIPDDNGDLCVGKANRIKGTTRTFARKVASECGINMGSTTKYVNAIVFDGAIVFPKERIVKWGGTR